MSTEKNKLVMNRFVEFINTADEKLAQELISVNAKFYVPGRPEPMQGPAGYLAIIGMMRSGFPDIQWALEETIAEGDKVAARFMMRGTHRGSFFGVPPTGKSIAVQAMNFYRLSDGQFMEEYGMPDRMELLQQIGALPV
jgi:steroid delta-isomerase-like uncharacterized protein